MLLRTALWIVLAGAATAEAPHEADSLQAQGEADSRRQVGAWCGSGGGRCAGAALPEAPGPAPAAAASAPALLLPSALLQAPGGPRAAVEDKGHKDKKERRTRLAFKIILLILFFLKSQLFFMLDKLARTGIFAGMVLLFKLFVLVKFVELKRYLWWLKELKREEYEASFHDHHYEADDYHHTHFDHEAAANEHYGAHHSDEHYHNPHHSHHHPHHYHHHHDDASLLDTQSWTPWWLGGRSLDSPQRLAYRAQIPSTRDPDETGGSET